MSSSCDERVRCTLWLEANKGPFAAVCRGVIGIEPDRAQRLIKRAQGTVVAIALGLTFRIAASAAGRKRSPAGCSPARARRMTRNDAPAYLRVARWRIRVPRRRGARIALGLALLVRGVLPPAGFVLLSMDSPTLRRWRRRLSVRLARRRKRA
jgi:hypothetical protein